MPRLHEDPATRRVVDTDSPAYQAGVRAANKLITHERTRLSLYRLQCEVIMAEMVKEDMNVADHWGIYLVLKGMLDTFGDYVRERSDV